MDDKYYLEEGFDPKSLKVAQLRGILNEYDIKYPSNAKKQQLIKLFNTQLKPVAKKLLDDYKNSIENSNDKGFVDVSRKDKIDEPPGQSINTSSGSSEPEELESPTSEQVEHGKGKHEQVDATDKGDKPKNTSRSSTPDIKEESPFTNENVFQSPNNSLDRSMSKKRSKNDDDRKIHKKVKSSPAMNKSIFDTSSDSDNESFESNILTRTPNLNKVISPKKLRSITPINNKVMKETPIKVKSPRETPIKVSASKVVKSSNSTPKDVKLVSPNTTTPKVTTPKITTNETNSSQPTKSILEHESTLQSNENFNSLEEEELHFNKELSKIKNFDPQQLASELGITIQGLPPKGFELNDKSFGSNNERNERKIDSTPSPRTSIIPQSNKWEIEKVNEDVKQEIDKSEREYEEEEEETEEEEAETTSSSITRGLNQLKSNISQDFSNLNKLIKKPKNSFKSIFSFIILWFLLLSVCLFGYWYREQTILIGYCGQEINQPTFPNSTNYPSWLFRFGHYLDSKFKPNCIPCPPHARCYPNLQIGCYEDFIEFKPWYSFINPTLKKCIPDTKKAEKLEIMIDVALDLLRTKNANKNCGRSPLNKFDAGISLSELHDLLFSMKAPYITIEEFDELWQRSIIELEKEPEIITGYSTIDLPTTSTYPNNTSKEKEENKIFRSTSLSNINLKCQLQNTIIQTIFRFKYLILTFLLGLIIFKFSIIKYKQRKLENIKIEIINNEVIKKLTKQNRLSKSNSLVPSYIGSTQLRDLILMNEKNLSKRLKLWNEASKKIESNSNVRSKLIENHGEIMKVWEWISDIEIES